MLDVVVEFALDMIGEVLAGGLEMIFPSADEDQTEAEAAAKATEASDD
jgi:hypothetical protein